MNDGQGRIIDYLRISVTDRCNLRCVYCMPEAGVPALAHGDVLRFEEIARVVRVMAGLGVRHLRVTGGEPMARRGCLDLIALLHGIPGVESLAMTSNGILLADRVGEAKAAGLTALNLSLDALTPARYAALTRGGDVHRVLTTLDRALDAGLNVKLNCIPVRGQNEGELAALAALAKDRPLCVRFIELMPLGCASALSPIPPDEVRERLTEAFGPMAPAEGISGHGPAEYVRPAGFTGAVGFIGALSHAFCDRCNRVRLTADGQLKLCLNHSGGPDLRALLRGGATDRELAETIKKALSEKPARHNFREPIADREARTMNGIGG